MKTAALAVLGLLSASPGLACSCAGPNPVCSAYWTTPTLFVGRVVRIEHIYNEPPQERNVNGKTIRIVGPGENLVHFEVAKSYRGAADRELVIHTADQGSACGFAFEQGRGYLVYASASPNGGLATGTCSRTHAVASLDGDPDIQWLEALPTSPAGVTISGTIQSLRPNPDGGSSSTPLTGIAVSITGPDSRTLTSDAGGKFRAAGLPPGKYVVSASPPKGYAAFPPYTVTLQDRSCGEVVWATSLDGHIRGHTYFADGTPAGGVHLTVKAANAQPHEPWTWHASDSPTAPDGSFDFARLAPGSYVLAANMDFPPMDGKPYYRKAFFASGTQRAEAAILNVVAGEAVENLRFFLPPDAAPPTIPIAVTVLGFDGKPVAHAHVMAADDIWENSIVNVTADADENGKVVVKLRAGSHYDVQAYADQPDFTQACAEPAGVDPRDSQPPLVLVLRHHFGNCMQFRKPR